MYRQTGNCMKYHFGKGVSVLENRAIVIFLFSYFSNTVFSSSSLLLFLLTAVLAKIEVSAYDQCNTKHLSFMWILVVSFQGGSKILQVLLSKWTMYPFLINCGKLIYSYPNLIHTRLPWYVLFASFYRNCAFATGTDDNSIT